MSLCCEVLSAQTYCNLHVCSTTCPYIYERVNAVLLVTQQQLRCPDVRCVNERATDVAKLSSIPFQPVVYPSLYITDTQTNLNDFRLNGAKINIWKWKLEKLQFRMHFNLRSSLAACFCRACQFFSGMSVLTLALCARLSWLPVSF